MGSGNGGGGGGGGAVLEVEKLNIQDSRSTVLPQKRSVKSTLLCG